MKLQLIEPLLELFKNTWFSIDKTFHVVDFEILALGHLPAQLVGRHPFPRPAMVWRFESLVLPVPHVGILQLADDISH